MARPSVVLTVLYLINGSERDEGGWNFCKFYLFTKKQKEGDDGWFSVFELIKINIKGWLICYSCRWCVAILWMQPGIAILIISLVVLSVGRYRRFMCQPPPELEGKLLTLW